MKPPPVSRHSSKNSLELPEGSRYDSFFKAETTGVVIEICIKYPVVPLERGGLV
jgi:hypothetical protein